MLHILWLIIKCILILLGIVAGLILLVLLLLLFCPVRYRGQARKERLAAIKKTEVSGEVSWLFHGIAVKASLSKGKPVFEFYILGISLSRLKKLFKRKKKKTSSSADGSTKKKASASGKKVNNTSRREPTPQVPVTEKAETEEFRKDRENSQQKENMAFVSSAAEAEDQKETAEAVEESDDEKGIEEYGTDHESLDTETQTKNGIISLIFEIAGKIKEAFFGMLAAVRKFLGIPSRIFRKIQNIRLTIKKFCGKIDWYKEFINHPRTREAISLAWKDAKKLLHHILPTRITGRVTFGSEDPAITGMILAALGMTIPFHKNAVAVNPLFDSENVLEGEVMLKGRIYGVVLLKTAAELYFNKNIKYVIHRWRHKEVNHGERE